MATRRYGCGLFDCSALNLPLKRLDCPRSMHLNTQNNWQSLSKDRIGKLC